jgi:cytochrome c biogenesis protein CcmG, thiol:disulfide interchange protein DsbE
MNWRKSLVGMAIALPIVALLAYGLTLDPRSIPSPLPGRPAPEFALPLLDEPDTVRLADMRGQVVVLNFFASWCLECRFEHGDLSTAAMVYEPRGVRFFGIVYNDTPTNARAWIREMGGQTYPALLDTGSRVAVSYGLYGVPETFIIDRDGIVVHKQIGPITLSRLAALLEPLLVEPAADAADAAAADSDAEAAEEVAS